MLVFEQLLTFLKCTIPLKVLDQGEQFYPSLMFVEPNRQWNYRFSTQSDRLLVLFTNTRLGGNVSNCQTKSLYCHRVF